MALFKISKGSKANLPTTLTEGFCWYTYDDSKFYIDYKDADGNLARKALNAQDAETLMGKTIEEIVASIKTSEIENDSGFVTKQIIPISVNSQFAVSTSGTDLTENMTKNAATSALTTRQRAIAYGNGVWVAGDATGALQRSTDNGVTWTKVPALTNKHGVTETTTITGLTYGKGYFVAVSYGNPAANPVVEGTVYKSTDGLNWSIVETNVAGLGDVNYLGGRFVFVAKSGEVAFSDDLERFQLINIGYAADFATLAYGKDRYFAGTGDSSGNVDTQRIYYSLDGLTWTPVLSDVLAAGNGSDYWGGACYGKGKYLLGGRSRTLNDQTYSIAYSDDCETWLPAVCPSAMFVRAIEYIYGKFFAVGYNGSVGEIWSSLDGINWQVESTGLTRQWVLGCGDDFLLSLGDSGSGMRYVFNIEWLDTEPEISTDEVLWQKTQLRLTDSSLLESEVEVHTNLTAIKEDYLQRQENTTKKINLSTTNEGHFNSSKSLYLGNSTTGNLKDETSFIATDDEDGNTPALQKISVQMKDGNFYVRNRTNQPVVEIRNKATKSTTGGVTTTTINDNDIRLRNVDAIKIEAKDEVSVSSSGSTTLHGYERTNVTSADKLKLEAPEVFATTGGKIELVYDQNGSEESKLKLNSEGSVLASKNKTSLRYENDYYGEGRVVLLPDAVHGNCSELEIEVGYIEAQATHGMTLNGEEVATMDRVLSRDIDEIYTNCDEPKNLSLNSDGISWENQFSLQNSDGEEAFGVIEQTIPIVPGNGIEFTANYEGFRYEISSVSQQSVTYRELKSLRDSGRLIPGMQYRITDYVTTTTQENTRSAGHQFDIIVTALSENTLSENARAIQHGGILRVDWLHTFMPNAYGNETPIGDAGVEENNKGEMVPVLYKYIIGEDGDALDIDYDEKWFYVGEYEIDGEIYSRWQVIEPEYTGDERHDWDNYRKYMLTGHAVENGELTVSPEELVALYYMYDDFNSVYVGSGQDERYIGGIDYLENNEGETVPVLYESDLDYPEPNIDEPYYYVGRYTYKDKLYDRWRKIDASGLDWDDDKRKYILTNIVVGDDGQFMGSMGDTYFANCNLNAWEIKYSLDNDKTRFCWAEDKVWIGGVNSRYSNGQILTRFPEFDGQLGFPQFSEYYYAWGVQADANDGDPTNFVYSKTEDVTIGDTVYIDPDVVAITSVGTGGKGVIYYLKDEWSNECHYDFKNIMFKRSAEWFAEHDDWAQSVFGESIDGDKWFYTFTWIDEDDNIQDLTLVGNTLTNDEQQIDGVYSNKIGMVSAYSLSIYETNVAALPHNIFINYMEDGCFYGCKGNVLGIDCTYNSFGSSCSYNTLNDRSAGNAFGHGCCQNLFGAGCSDNVLGNSCSVNTFETECWAIKVVGDTIRNIRVCQGVCTTTLSPEQHANHQQIYRKSGTQEILVD